MEIEQVVEAYFEDKGNRGNIYAQERLRQKLVFSCLDKLRLHKAICDWQEKTKRNARKEILGYCFVLLIAITGIFGNLYVVLNPRFSDNKRMIYCCVEAAGIVLFTQFVVYLWSVAKRIKGEAAVYNTLQREISEKKGE